MEKMITRGTRPNLRTRKFSLLHICIFEQILTSSKTNQQLNLEFGYTLKSHCVVDHSRKVMYKLLMLEELKKDKCKDMVIYPRKYKFWWMRLLNKHRNNLTGQAVVPVYYENADLSWSNILG